MREKGVGGREWKRGSGEMRDNVLDWLWLVMVEGWIEIKERRIEEYELLS